MRKLIVIITAVAALAAPAAALANASHMTVGPTGTPVGTLIGSTQGSKRVTHYKAAYTDGFFGPVSCTGTHHGTSVPGSFDSFTCRSPIGSPLTNVEPGETLTCLTGNYPGWNSDFNGVGVKTFTATVSADGTSYTAVATY